MIKNQNTHMGSTEEKTKLQYHNQILKSHAHIWNHTFNFIKSMSLKCALELSIPDIIHQHGGPMTISELLLALPSVCQSKSQHIHRLMRVLVQSGFFSIHKSTENLSENQYQLTPESLLLLKDHPTSARPYVLAVLDPIMTGPWQWLSSWFECQDIDLGSTPFSMANGRVLWEFASGDDRFNRVFNQAMASDSWLIGEVVTGQCKELFDGLGSMVDVGGGTGSMAKAIASAFPWLNVLVLDLPHVVDGLKDCGNLKFVDGNMFDYIPPADAFFFKMIFHLLSGEECLKLLKKCKEAMNKNSESGSSGKLMIVDIVMEKENKIHGKAEETTELYDLEMMVLVSGIERTEDQWAKLFFDAGFTSYKIHHVLGLRSLIEVFP